MAIGKSTSNRYTCLRTDSKPTTGYPAGTVLEETDTGLEYVFDGTYWFLKPGATNPFWKKTGRYYGNLAVGDGLFSSLATPAGQASTSMIIGSTAGKMYRNFVTGTVANNNAGLKGANNFAARILNPKMMVRFLLPTAVTDFRFYCGFTDNSVGDPTTDDPINTKNGFFFGVITTDTHWVTMTNSGAAQATQITATSTLWDDNTWHTILLVGDEANARWAWKLDSGAYNFFSASTPGSTTAMIPVAVISTTGAAKTIGLNSAYIEEDAI